MRGAFFASDAAFFAIDGTLSGMRAAFFGNDGTSSAMHAAFFAIVAAFFGIDATFFVTRLTMCDAVEGESAHDGLDHPGPSGLGTLVVSARVLTVHSWRNRAAAGLNDVQEEPPRERGFFVRAREIRTPTPLPLRVEEVEARAREVIASS